MINIYLYVKDPLERYVKDPLAFSLFPDSGNNEKARRYYR